MSRQIVIKARTYSAGKATSEVVTSVLTIPDDYVLGYKGIAVGYNGEPVGYDEWKEENENK